jgi:hypothetical protein
MNRACCRPEEGEKCVQILVESLKVKDRLEGLGIGERIILK